VLAFTAVVAIPILARSCGGAGETATPELPRVVLIEPKGALSEAPALFRWEPVPGAALYRLTIADRDTVWPLARRETDKTSYRFAGQERRMFSLPRSYEWSVEALAVKNGPAFARGEGFFAIMPWGPPAPDSP
jgi:hypothetical protein